MVSLQQQIYQNYCLEGKKKRARKCIIYAQQYDRPIDITQNYAIALSLTYQSASLVVDKETNEFVFVLQKAIDDFFDTDDVAISEIKTNLHYPQVRNDLAFMLSCWYGQITIIKWLVYLEIQCVNYFGDILVRNQAAFEAACSNGQLEIAKWLLTYSGQRGHNIQIDGNENAAFRLACNGPHLQVINWLLSKQLPLESQENISNYLNQVLIKVGLSNSPELNSNSD